MRRRWKRWCLLLLLGVIGGIMLVRLRYLPLAQRLVAMQIDNETSNLIVDAVNAQLDAGEIDYDRLVTLVTGADGRLTAVQANTGEMNRLKAKILAEIDARIREFSVEQLSVPLGNVVLPVFFSGRGSLLPVKLVALRSSNAEFQSSLSQAAINQTLHRIDLEVSVSLLVLGPGGTMELCVQTTVPVAQTVIVGQVPDTLIENGVR